MTSRSAVALAALLAAGATRATDPLEEAMRPLDPPAPPRAAGGGPRR